MRTVRFVDPTGVIREGSVSNGAVRFGGKRSYSKDEVRILPPVTPSKVVAVGKNFMDDSEESETKKPMIPKLYLKSTNSIVSHNSTLTLPSSEVKPGAELGVVIGKNCRDVEEIDVEEVISGYTCAIDMTNRAEPKFDSRTDGLVGELRRKSFDGAAPLGPVLATTDEVPENCTIRLHVNGDVIQEATRSEFIFSIEEVIAETSRYVTLSPGDVILMGEPSGTKLLSAGDSVTAEVEGVGRLRTDITSTND